MICTTTRIDSNSGCWLLNGLNTDTLTVKATYIFENWHADNQLKNQWRLYKMDNEPRSVGKTTMNWHETYMYKLFWECLLISDCLGTNFFGSHVLTEIWDVESPPWIVFYLKYNKSRALSPFRPSGRRKKKIWSGCKVSKMHSMTFWYGQK